MLQVRRQMSRLRPDAQRRSTPRPPDMTACEPCRASPDPYKPCRCIPTAPPAPSAPRLCRK